MNWEKNTLYTLKTESVVTPMAMIRAKSFLIEEGYYKVAALIDSMPEDFLPKTRMAARISKWGHENGHPYLDEYMVEQLGTAIGEGRLDAGEYTFDFTDEFNWSAGDFGDSGSCYWEGYRYLREDVMPYNGFWAMRTWQNGRGIGRCWMAPYRESDWIIFNGYGPGQLKLFANLLQVWGNKVATRVHLGDRSDSDNSDFYINSGMGYVVADEEHSIRGRVFFQWREPLLTCPVTGLQFRRREAYFLATYGDEDRTMVSPEIAKDPRYIQFNYDTHYVLASDAAPVLMSDGSSTVFFNQQIDRYLKRNSVVPLADGRYALIEMAEKDENGNWFLTEYYRSICS